MIKYLNTPHYNVLNIQKSNKLLFLEIHSMNICSKKQTKKTLFSVTRFSNQSEQTNLIKWIQLPTATLILTFFTQL